MIWLVRLSMSGTGSSLANALVCFAGASELGCCLLREVCLERPGQGFQLAMRHMLMVQLSTCAACAQQRLPKKKAHAFGA